MEIEREAIAAYISKYHFEEFEKLFLKFKYLPSNMFISNDPSKCFTPSDKHIAIIDKVKIKLQDLVVGKSGYAAFWQDQDHMRRMDRMDADATNVTPKILME
jgi:hypothetical protein